ncbi:MAG: hypothetical protein JWO31_4013, partial [Phycisphaerales bacterium]|nr:hypothetical protein [Phycisphaerales bacterium]
VGWATAAQMEAAGTACHADGLWTFPLRDPDGSVVGIRVRTRSGKKYAVTGSDGSGLFVPSGLTGITQLILPEGPTSAAALLTAGFAAAGRPNNAAGADQAVRLCRRLRPTRVVVLGDNDFKPPDDKFPAGRWPGREGAESVATALRRAVPDVRVVLPPGPDHGLGPDGVKDARAWLRRAGPSGLRLELSRAIGAACRAAFAGA